MFALKRILVPTNHGEPSRAAIRYGVAFARQFGARLYLLHVLPDKAFDAVIETERVVGSRLSGSTNPNAVVPDPDPDDVARHAAQEDMSRLLSVTDTEATDAQFLMRPAGSSGPGDEIVACARELDVELIIIGKHRLGFVEHLLAGSVTEKVVRQAPCPVLIVQHPEHDFVVPDDRAGATID